MQITYSTEHCFCILLILIWKRSRKFCCTDILNMVFIAEILKYDVFARGFECLNNINTSNIFCYIYISSENLVSQQQYKRRLAVDMWCEKYDLQNKTIRWFRAPFNKQTLLRNSQIITKSFPPKRFAYALCMH